MRDQQARGIYKRGRIYWLAAQKSGKRVFVSLETEDFSEAIRRAADARSRPELNEGGLLLAEIDRFCKWKLDAGEYTANTSANAKNFLRHLPLILGNVRPADVSARDARRFYDTLRARIKETSAQSYVAQARSFFQWCHTIAHVTATNPFSGLKLPKLVPAARTAFCDAALRNRLITECPRDDLRFVLFCGFHAGMRRNEIVHARPEWFDLQHHLIHLKKLTAGVAKTRGLDPFDLKDREERTVPLSTEFETFLRQWLDTDDAYCLGPDKRSAKWRYRYDFIRFFERYMQEQGCAWVTPHVMRHTFASLAATNGVSIYIISQWIGDDVRTTQKHYARLSPAHDEIARALK